MRNQDQNQEKKPRLLANGPQMVSLEVIGRITDREKMASALNFCLP